MKDVLILIPARYGSSRFPGKPLAKIKDKSMISYVIDNCNESGFDYAVVTDDDRIESHIKEIGGHVVRVDDDVTTGSERIYLAYERYFSDKNYQYIINVQGDEPLLNADLLKSIQAFHLKNQFDVLTAVKKRESSEEAYSNPNVVKCIYSTNNSQALYFTRASAPYARDDSAKEKGFYWYQHIGVYSYTTDALKKFVNCETSRLENLEKLEQLRVLENGMTIGAIETDINLIGVDTPADIHKVEGVIGG